MKDIQKDLKQLKDNIDNAKNNLAKLQGREMELLKQLKKDYQINSIEDAQKEFTRLDKDYLKRVDAIEKDYKKLKEDYDW
jgi:uncharacterized membrane-anchored protein YhcB (DUF1043 family)